MSGNAHDAARLTVGVLQFAPGADQDDNLAAIDRLTAEAANRGAGLVVGPEYASSFTGGPSRATAESAEDLDGPFVTALGKIARRHDVHLVVGMAERTSVLAAHGSVAGPSDRYFNTLVAVAPSGDVVARYRKIHLYDAFGARESEFVASGDPRERPQTFRVRGFRVGLATCYDLRFPESVRVLADEGADVVCIPAQWVPGPRKERHWQTLLAARAIESTVAVVAADHPAPHGVGLSSIVNPWGDALASLGAEEGVAVAELSGADIARVRSVNPSLELRRFRVIPGD